MSLSGAHKAAFRREATQEGRVFTIRDGIGYPAPADPDGHRAVPFWSKPTRAQRVVAHVDAYRGFEIVPVTVREWLVTWMSSLERDGLLVGVNWAGSRATGYDMTPVQVLRWFAEVDVAAEQTTRQ
jgi:Protein of unknown function (DUF2750)